MKKFMTIVLAAALVFAVAGQASATALETSGEFRGRFWYLSDYKMDGNTDFFDQRLRVNGAWKVSDTVKVGFRADILENVWDTTAGEATYKQEIDFDQAYAAMGVGPGTLTVGKQDVTWGLGVYAKADNRYRAKYGAKFGDIAVSAAVDQLDQVGKWSKDDIGYTLGATMPVAGWNLGGLLVARNDDPNDAKFYALDLTGAGAVGPAKISFEAAYGVGDQGDADLSGLMGYVGAFMPAGPVNVGVEAAYARGNDAGDTDNEGYLQQDYQGPFSSFILFNNFDLDGYVSNYGTDLGVQNALALKASAGYAVTKQFSLWAAGVWAQADETAAGQDDSLGVEADVLAKYAVNENVTLQAGFGYLWIGDYFGDNADDPMVVTAQAVVTF